MATIKTSTLFPVRIGTPVPEPVFYSSIGGLAYTEVSRQYQNGDGTGRYITFKYRGSKDALRAASADWVAAGGKYQINEDGPYSEATVTFAGSQIDPNNPTAPVVPEEEEPSTRFEFRTEYLDASLFALPYVRAEAKKWVQTYSTINITEADYYAAIKLAGEDPKNNKLNQVTVGGVTTPANIFPESQFPLAHQLVVKFSRGQDSFQTSRVSLTRISSFSARNGLPATPPIISAVYSGDILAARNGFPESVRLVMPRPPFDPNLTPDGTVWSWLKTNDSTSLLIKTNQVERNETWTFAAWDLFAYPYNPTT
jgi:hypothetical protein